MAIPGFAITTALLNSASVRATLGRHEAGAVMQTDYAGHTIPVVGPGTGEMQSAQIFVAVLGASNDTFAWASLTQRLPDWIDAQVRALTFFGGVPPNDQQGRLSATISKLRWPNRFGLNPH